MPKVTNVTEKDNPEKLEESILEALDLPILERCEQMRQLFACSQVRDLQEIFPTLVQSIFSADQGGLDWGLRTTTKENGRLQFSALFDFFTSSGPMLGLCYRLLHDTIKFPVNLQCLPFKVINMITNGQHSFFYADLVNIDPFHRQVTSLSLNSFDYYMLHFALYAVLPMHKTFPAALQVHNERLKTVYYALTMEYLQNFLPKSVNDIVQPFNIGYNIKVPQVVSNTPLPQPQRSPKYLKISLDNSIYQHSVRNSPPMHMIQNVEMQRVYTWRSESVLFLFTDIWLRYDINEIRELPSSEFIRLIRLFIKHAHTFSSSVNFDETPMKVLRKQTEPMLRHLFYPFLRAVIARWPLDSSQTLLIELWLCYIQPWRYQYPLSKGKSLASVSQLSQDISRYSAFIQDNLLVYTQVFVELLPRLERIDYSYPDNVLLLLRLIKTLGQPTLSACLVNAETYFASTLITTDSPHKHPSLLSCNSIANTNNSWDSVYNAVYIPFFSAEVRTKVESLVRVVCLAMVHVQEEIETINKTCLSRHNSMSFWGKLYNRLFRYKTSEDKKLQSLKNISPVFDAILEEFSNLFMIDLSEISISDMQYPDNVDTSSSHFLRYNDTNYDDLSKLISSKLNSTLEGSNLSIDPETQPVRKNECLFLARLLYKVTSNINKKYADEIEAFWNSPGLLGKVLRKILYGPMTVHWFDKSLGLSELVEEQLRPRLSLRFLASYQYLFLIIVSFAIGYQAFGGIVSGLLGVCCIYILILLVFALLSKDQ